MEKIKFMDEETGRFLSRIYFSLPDDEGNYRSCYYGVLFKPARKASWTGEKAVMGCIRLPFFHVLPPCRAIQPVSCRDFSFSRSCTYLMETA